MSRVDLQELPPLSLYIHIPWCVKKCPYCDFNSHTADGILPEQAYIQALIQDLDSELDVIQSRQLVSIFFGGGTPSLLSSDAIASILAAVGERVDLQQDIEITLEANPGTTDEANFTGFRQAGINRLSIGIQSFDDHALGKLGRIHTAADAQRAVSCARNAGFEAINLDLMYGLPGQTAEQAMTDLQQGLALAPCHLSWYELTVEPNTAFYSQPPPLPAETELERMEERGHALLARAGFDRYEVSAYSRSANNSSHNMNYWQFGDYLGIGAGAHSKISRLRDMSISRHWKTRMPAEYMNAGVSKTAGKRELMPSILPLEFMMNALRLRQGVSRELYQARTGTDISNIETTLHQLQARGLLANDPSVLRTTAAGYKHLNTVLQKFMQE